MSTKRVGLLTAGGDCPGLNAVIRGVVKTACHVNPAIEVVGVLDGYAGLIENRLRRLTDDDVSGLLIRGGTILGTSNRDNPFRYIPEGKKEPEDRTKDVLNLVEREKLDGLICVGGDGTLSCANRLSQLGIPVIGVPKTIDNDLGGTDVTFGFDTAVTIATEAVDRLHTTAESHHRILICEVMGRYAGWIALYSGLAGGADIILIPEIPYRMEKILEAIKGRAQRGKNFSIIVVAEGAKPVDGEMFSQSLHADAEKRPRLGGISHQIAEELEKHTEDETRVVILGHLQRGGTPTAFDRFLATRFGVKAVQLAQQGLWGNMACLRGREITHVSLAEAVGKLHRVEPDGPTVQAARLVRTSFGD